MKQDKKAVLNAQDLQSKINALDKDSFHIFYFSYHTNWHNIYHSPLMMLIKTAYWVKREVLFRKGLIKERYPLIDHICQSSRFMFDEETDNWTLQLFEANFERGMETNDAIDRFKKIDATIYIETLGEVDKTKARLFEKEYYGVAYDKVNTALSEIDGVVDRVKVKPKGGWCSWLLSSSLIDQGYNLGHIEKGNPREMTPADIWLGNLGAKKLFYKS
ncbi:MAG: hypothetical protein ACRC6O_13240 [Flavobacterium sp.]